MTPVKAARERKKLTIYDVAKKVGLSPASVSRIENRKQGVSTITARKMAEALGIPEIKILYPERFTRS